MKIEKIILFIRPRPQAGGLSMAHFFLAALMMLLILGCSTGKKPGSHKGQGHGKGHGHDKGHKGHGHDKGHKGHGHSGSKTMGPGALKRIAKTSCEHKVPILECTQCRYEVGAIEVGASLLKPGGDNLIKTARVSRASRRGKLRLTGEVAFDEKKIVHVTPRIKGIARRVFVQLGDRVKSWAWLVEMDSIVLGQLRSRYLQALARLGLARKNYLREKKLHKKRIASGKELLQAETAYQEARIAVSAAREQLHLLGFSNKSIKGLAGNKRKGIARMVIRAPMAGIVIKKHVVKGERLSPEKEMLTIADLSRVWVWANVYARDLGALLAASAKAKLQATVRVAAFADRLFPGKVDYIGATMEEATRTVRVRVVVRNKKLLLRPGMFADVSIHLNQGSRKLAVPARAVVEDGKERFVFVKIGPRRFLRRDIRLGATWGGMAEVVKGLNLGEEIVVQGAFLLKSDILREKMGAGCAD